MSLTRKLEMSGKKLSANRTNGAKSRGAVTRAGKARAAAANLRHGFYAKQQNQAMLALGEEPKEYAQLLNSLENDLSEGLEGELVERIARTLWRLRRVERMQNGLAVERLRSGLKMGQIGPALNWSRANKKCELITDLSRKIMRPDYVPSEADIQLLEDGLGEDSLPELKEVCAHLRSLAETAPSRPAGSTQSPNSPTTDEEAEHLDPLRIQIEIAISMLMNVYDKKATALLEECERVRSPENFSALMAPKDENDSVMQRTEESSFRQLERLTNVLIKVRSGALRKRKNRFSDCSHDVDENKGEIEATVDCSDDLHENE